MTKRLSLGIVGLGAFGRLVARHLAQHVVLHFYDPNLADGHEEIIGLGTFGPIEDAAGCDVVLLAVPVGKLRQVVLAIAPLLREGAVVIDVGSVKVLSAQTMLEGLPEHVEIVGTHPLFGPQSARNGISGLKIAICPIRGGSWRRIADFCRQQLALEVVVATPEMHDREAAMVQGLTHLIAKVLVKMEPFPTSMTTPSFELLIQAIEMVRYDSPEVFDAIERMNPFVPLLRRRFFDLAADLDRDMASRPI